MKHSINSPLPSPLLYYIYISQKARPRRNRKSPIIRAMLRESIIRPSNFIYPLFIHDNDTNDAIRSMPGCIRHSINSMIHEVNDAFSLGIKTFMLFPTKIPTERKCNYGLEAYNPNGLIQRAVRIIKENYPESIVCTDVALDPYSDRGHDGVVEVEVEGLSIENNKNNGQRRKKKSIILNDVTVCQLCKQAVSQAYAGVDIVAPSDMMVSVVFVFGLMILYTRFLSVFDFFVRERV